jgi:hypothetical protein
MTVWFLGTLADALAFVPLVFLGGLIVDSDAAWD